MVHPHLVGQSPGHLTPHFKLPFYLEYSSSEMPLTVTDGVIKESYSILIFNKYFSSLALKSEFDV